MAKQSLKRQTTRAVRWLRKRHGHGVHSPFAYRLITRVIEERFHYYCYQEIETIRQRILKGRLTRTQLRLRREMSFKRASLLFRLVNHFKPTTILELGSAWGVSTLYLRHGNPHATYHCIEPEAEVCSLAEAVVAAAGSKVAFHTAPVAEVLPSVLEQLKTVDFLFVHNLADIAAILPYMNQQSVVVVAGIHSHKCVAKQWKHFVSDSRVRVSMDLYDFGIVVYSPKYNKQHYRVAF